MRILIRVIPVVLVLGVALLLAGRELMDRYLDTPLPVKQSFLYPIENGRGLGSGGPRHARAGGWAACPNGGECGVA